MACPFFSQVVRVLKGRRAMGAAGRAHRSLLFSLDFMRLDAFASKLSSACLDRLELCML
jgi:hypothetical protein